MKIRRPVWPVGRSTKKGIYTIEKFSLYFTHLPRSPKWTDLHEILHGGSSRRRNYLFQILCRSVQGFRICAGSPFLPLLSQSPLTQGCATARLWSAFTLYSDTVTASLAAHGTLGILSTPSYHSTSSYSLYLYRAVSRYMSLLRTARPTVHCTISYSVLFTEDLTPVPIISLVHPVSLQWSARVWYRAIRPVICRPRAAILRVIGPYTVTATKQCCLACMIDRRSTVSDSRPVHWDSSGWPDVTSNDEVNGR